MQDAQYALAIHDYQTEEESLLSFMAGDIIVLKNRENEEGRWHATYTNACTF